MAKKSARKPTGAARMAVIEGDLDDAADGLAHESNGNQSESEKNAAKPGRKARAKPAESSEHFAVSDIKKAAAFANSVGGLDKAIAVLQILKVAKDVQ
jgi:hypothetical protein